MSDSRFSKMLTKSFPTLLLLFGIQFISVDAQALPECSTAEFVGGPCYNSADGDYYIMTKNKKSTFSNKHWKTKARKMTNSEMRAHGIISVTVDCNGKDTEECRKRARGDGGGNTGGGDRRSRPCGGSGEIPCDDGRTVIYEEGGGSRRASSAGDVVVRRGRGMSASGEYDLLKERCMDFDDYADERARRKEEVEELLKRYSCSDASSDCIDLDGMKRAMDAALASDDCHEACLGLAAKGGDCSFSKVYGKAADFCADVHSDFANVQAWKDLVATMSEADQAACKTPGKNSGLSRNAAFNQANLCSKMLKSAACGKSVKDEHFCSSQELGKKIAEYEAALKEKNELVAELKVLNGATKVACRIKRSSEICSRWSSKETLSLKCIDDIRSSCEDALADALARVDEEGRSTVSNGGFCPNCDIYNRQAGVCLYGPCNGGVSKAAQIIGAAAGIVTPIGLGLINMGIYNRGINACMSAYQMQVQQATVVGLPPQQSMCGVGGYGMGGFMGGMGGMGGFPGMGMGGFPGMGGGFGMGGFPGMGMGGMGMGLGLNIGMGMGGMPGMGMGMGMGFPGMGGMGGMYPGMGMGMPGMGMPGMGMPGMGFPGMGMGGMGGMGLGMNNMMASQGNMYGVQEQMFAAQQRMQQMMAQNMVIQQSQYMGYGMNGQYGMGYPAFGMGQQGMGMPGMGMPGMGIQGGFGMNPMYGQFGGYNPYGNMGYGGFGGGGFSAGINIGLPSINAYAGASPYGYGGYGGYGQGYGYGGAGACGYQMGIPCYQ